MSFSTPMPQGCPVKTERYRYVEWRIDEQGNNWFVIPKSNKQLLANEKGEFHHALSWFEFSVSWEGDYIEWGFNEGAWNHWFGCRGLSTSDILALGEELYGLLIGNGCPLWSAELPVMQQWAQGKVFTINKKSILILESSEERDLRCKKPNRPRRTRAEMQAAKEEKDRCRRDREIAAAQRAALESSSTYLGMFELIYGKALGAISESDNASLVCSAKRLARFRITGE